MANSELTEFLSNENAPNYTKTNQSQSQNCANQTNSNNFQSRARWKILSKAVKSKQFQRPTLENGHLIDDFLPGGSSSSSASSKTQTPEPLTDSPQDSPKIFLASDSNQLLIQAYNLMSYEYLDNPKSLDTWIKCRFNDALHLPSNPLNLKLLIKFVPNILTVQDLAGFDNSGNVRLWPCEELLAYLVAFGPLRERLRGTRVLELGAGMIALAGLVLASMDLSQDIYLTDGNDRCVTNIEDVVEHNFSHDSAISKAIHVQKLRWEVPIDYASLKHRIESIICADCLFVRKHHRDLLATLDALLILSPKKDLECPLLDPIGTCYILAPSRGKTMREFIELVRKDGRFQLWEFAHFDRAFDKWCQQGLIATSEVPYLLVMRRTESPQFTLDLDTESNNFHNSGAQ